MELLVHFFGQEIKINIDKKDGINIGEVYFSNQELLPLINLLYLVIAIQKEEKQYTLREILQKIKLIKENNYQEKEKIKLIKENNYQEKEKIKNGEFDE